MMGVGCTRCLQWAQRVRLRWCVSHVHDISCAAPYCRSHLAALARLPFCVLPRMYFGIAIVNPRTCVPASCRVACLRCVFVVAARIVWPPRKSWTSLCRWPISSRSRATPPTSWPAWTRRLLCPWIQSAFFLASKLIVWMAGVHPTPEALVLCRARLMLAAALC